MYQVNDVERATMLDFWKAERRDWYEIVFLLPVELRSFLSHPVSESNIQDEARWLPVFCY